MSGLRRFTGVARESIYSPGKVDADRAILEDTAKELAARGAAARIVEPERVADARRETDLVFAMCQGPEALRGLRRLARAGLPLVHDADAILACHRVRMLGLLADAGVARPAARLVPTARTSRATREWVDGLGPDGAWVKRGDVHATEAGDVVRVRGADDAAGALAGLAARGVRRAVLEAHVDGPTYKFYGVAAGGFFRVFQGDDPEPAEPAPGWEALASAGARALGLAVFGGDLVVDPSGRPWLVDVNDWPSFSRCRRDAASAIAQYLLARLREARMARHNPAPPDKELA